MDDVALEVNMIPGCGNGRQPCWIILGGVDQQTYGIAADERRAGRARKSLFGKHPCSLERTVLCRVTARINDFRLHAIFIGFGDSHHGSTISAAAAQWVLIVTLLAPRLATPRPSFAC